MISNVELRLFTVGVPGVRRDTSLAIREKLKLYLNTSGTPSNTTSQISDYFPMTMLGHIDKPKNFLYEAFEAV